MSDATTTTPTARWLGLVYASLALAALAVSLHVDAARPELAALVLFTALGLWAENWGIRLPSQVTISPSLMVVMAAIAAMDQQGMLVGIVVVGAANGMTKYAERTSRCSMKNRPTRSW